MRTGALVGNSFLHLIPEAYARMGSGLGAALAVLGGFLGFFLLERLLWHHTNAADVLLPIRAGSFLSIAAADLLPELQRGHPAAVTLGQLAAILPGIGVMLLPALAGE